MKPEDVKYLNKEERRHYMRCTDCGEYFDMRNLQEVFDHFLFEY